MRKHENRRSAGARGRRGQEGRPHKGEPAPRNENTEGEAEAGEESTRKTHPAPANEEACSKPESPKEIAIEMLFLRKIKKGPETQS